MARNKPSIFALYFTHEEEWDDDSSIQRAQPLDIEAGSAIADHFDSINFRVCATRRINDHIHALVQRPNESDFHLFVQISPETPWEPTVYFGEVFVKPGPTTYDFRVYVRVVPTEEERVQLIVSDEDLQQWAITSAEKLLTAVDRIDALSAVIDRWFSMLRGWEADAPGAPMGELHAQALGWLGAVDQHPNPEVRKWLPIWQIIHTAWIAMPEKGTWDHLAALHMVNGACYALLEEDYNNS